MELVNIPISDIKPYERNTRHNDDAVGAVAESIRQCEYIAPIILDEQNVILAGHTRWKALKKLGYTEAECVVKTGLTDEQKRKYRLLDNKTGELAEWDFDLLAEELDELDFGDLELDWGICFDDDYDESFTLPSGERGESRTMSFSLSEAQKNDIEAAIHAMKKTTEFAEYEDTENENGNGNALYLLVMRAWEQLKTSG